MHYKLLFLADQKEVEFTHPAEVRDLVYSAGFQNVNLWLLSEDRWEEIPLRGIQAVFMECDG